MPEVFRTAVVRNIEMIADPTSRFLSQGPVREGQRLVDPDRVAVWWLRLDRIPEGAWRRLEDLLSEQERERAARFRFERDRHTYIAAHALCRGLLSYCCGSDPRSWRFSVEDHGKPELILSAGRPRLRVNLSHTRGLAAAALTVEHDIGIDVEWLQRDALTESLANRVFTERERQQLEAAPETVKTDVFLQFWTLKEAYVKAIGKGLSQPLDAFSFDLDALQICFRDDGVGNPNDWLFKQCRPGDAHLMALAVHHHGRSGLALDISPAPLDYLLGLADD